MTSEAETMVERIERAIWTAPLLGQPPGYERRRWPPSDPEAVTEVNNQARAVLTALLDPTDAMIDAGADSCDFETASDPYAAECSYRAMIQAALQPGSEPQ